MSRNAIVELWSKRIEAGDRNIAVSNVGYASLQQKYILLFLSYMQLRIDFQNKKIGVVSFHLTEGVYAEHSERYFIRSLESAMTVPNNTGADFVDWKYLLHQNIPVEFLEYDTLLWDLPDLNFINSHSQQLKRFFELYDSMVILSSRPKGVDNVEHVKRISRFYDNHGLKLPKLLSSESTQETTQQKLSGMLRKVVGL